MPCTLKIEYFPIGTSPCWGAAIRLKAYQNQEHICIGGSYTTRRFARVQWYFRNSRPGHNEGGERRLYGPVRYRHRLDKCQVDLIHRGGKYMEYQYKSVEELPPFLNASQVAAFLGLSLSNIYTLMHSQGFPTLAVGKRKIVEKKKLLQWIEENTAK